MREWGAEVEYIMAIGAKDVIFHEAFFPPGTVNHVSTINMRAV